MAIAVLAVGAVVPAAPASAGGAVQISGVGLPGPGGCDAAADGVDPADYVLVMTGSLQGCLYGYTDVDSIQFRPSGTWLDRGWEVFVSADDPGDRFWTTQTFTAKFTEDGQQFGRCQHKVIGGEGAFDGATGQINFKDNIVDGSAVDFDYKGHIRH
ncbi:MAG: hypothetical protein HKN41_02125 [Ilumatobacter sp.]|nr:hypothetical protein [Ilumatobacter sp.]